MSEEIPDFSVKALKKAVARDEKILGPCCAAKDIKIKSLETELEHTKNKLDVAHSGQRMRELEAERDKFREALEYAIECVKNWALYADDYYKDKHGYAEDIKRLSAAFNTKEAS